MTRADMPGPKEIEIKLELPPASVPRLKRVPLLRGLKKPAERETQVSVYFDTDKHKLHRKGLTLRCALSLELSTASLDVWLRIWA